MGPPGAQCVTAADPAGIKSLALTELDSSPITAASAPASVAVSVAAAAEAKAVVAVATSLMSCCMLCCSCRWHIRKVLAAALKAGRKWVCADSLQDRKGSAVISACCRQLTGMLRRTRTDQDHDRFQPGSSTPAAARQPEWLMHSAAAGADVALRLAALLLQLLLPGALQPHRRALQQQQQHAAGTASVVGRMPPAC